MVGWDVDAVVLAGSWQPIAPGLERRSVERDGVELEALRIDRDVASLRVVVASELGRRSATARQFVEATGAMAAINGGFFDPKMRPVGLRMSGGETVAGAVQKNLQAFVVARDGARVVTGATLEGQLVEALEVVQCRPRLVVDGRAHRVKPQPTRRSAVGVDGDGRIILVVTARGVVSGPELGRWLAASAQTGGFGLEQALNLDGGGSSQMYVTDGLDVPGLTSVADAVVVWPGPSRP